MTSAAGIEVVREPLTEPAGAKLAAPTLNAAAPAPAESVAAASFLGEDLDAAVGVSLAGNLGLQRLWLSTQRRPWTTLALIPIGVGASMLPLATALAEVGRQHLGGPVDVRDATVVSLRTLQAELSVLAARARRGERTILALPPLPGSPAGLAVAQAADMAILCVALRTSEISEATHALDEVGRDRVLGSVILKERKEPR